MRLSIFQYYDAINTTAAQRTLTPAEKAFYIFCMDNHDAICNENTPDNDPIIRQAFELFKEIEEICYEGRHYPWPMLLDHRRKTTTQKRNNQA